MQTEVKAVLYPEREKGMMRRIKTTAALSMMMLALTASTASAATIPGGPYGDYLPGTNYADTIYGYGGADLIKGYGGNDALYGDSGNDKVYGGYGDDLVQGGYGYDFLDGGPGADRINAQDGQKDTIVIRSGEYDVVYYDRGLDVLQSQMYPQGTSARENAGMSVEEAIKAGKVKVDLRTEKPPKGLFEHTGKVLVEHKGKEMVVAEKEVKAHMAHGDHIIDPTGRAGAEQEGRR